MTDQEKSKAQLIKELRELRQKVNVLEQRLSDAGPGYDRSSPDGDLTASQTQAESALMVSGNPIPIDSTGLDACADIAVALSQLQEQTRERRKIEEALHRSEKEYRSLIDNLSIGIYRNTGGPRGTFIKANPAIAAIFGYDSVEAFMRVNVADLYVNPDDRRKFVDELMSRGSIRNKDLLLKRKDGSTFWVSCTANAKYDRNGKIVWIDGILEDITLRRRAEEALRENEFKFRSLFDLSPQAIALTDLESGHILAVNAKFCKLFQVSQDEAIGRSAVELGFYSESKRAVFLRKLRKKGEVHGLPMDFTPRLGQSINTLMFAKLIRINAESFILSIFHDVTEQKRLESQIHQVQRIEAIGTLAGGIAHDFNNLLMAIQGNVSLLRLSFDPNSALSQRLKTIEQYIQSGSDLTRQLLGFARGGKYEVKPININDLVRRSSRMFGRTKKQIKIVCELQADLWIVEVDKSQIEQVLLNLYLNAWQAMPNGGALKLQTENIVLDETFIRPFKVNTGRYVKISLKDSGVGMEEKTLQRIFDPLFTTREMGRGTGLGLASAYGIIKNHDGIIEARSLKDKGTTFELYLPASRKTIVETTDPSTAGRSDKVIKGSETILFVDDEEMILQVASEMLKDLGYRVLVAAGGTEALELYQQKKDAIDLVVLDLIMPDMSGQEVYRHLLELNPNIRVLFSSGYSVSGRTAATLEKGGCGFLQKPFNVSKLSRKLRELLGPAN